jgi:hypothetical protein
MEIISANPFSICRRMLSPLRHLRRVDHLSEGGSIWVPSNQWKSDRAHRVPIPTTTTQMTFRVFQATTTARNPAKKRGFDPVRSSLPPGARVSGKMIAVKTAMGTNRNARSIQSGSLYLPSSQIKDSRIRNVANPAAIMVSQIFTASSPATSLPQCQ